MTDDQRTKVLDEQIRVARANVGRIQKVDAHYAEKTVTEGQKLAWNAAVSNAYLPHFQSLIQSHLELGEIKRRRGEGA